ncbi:GNAT superfamily N-acetyltransferase [Bacillus tianshenii]|uniref:GNAT superfamily N-acetyltransferase n=1 Tax=Sutcliffiella tianshenii TaxID=1463404 RepID=A0ABS2P255_9BACI|nr:GNAT family N-acetyltransferase [Bacillus tianshenii]MBM7621042.1 GNAT superfamily N-acetyltransferase [Bacillus tianshenii]
MEIRVIGNLNTVDLSLLLEESKKEGYRFLERLVLEYQAGMNTFKNPGECLYAVFDDKNILVAIGGLNADPYSEDPGVGRLRRFYVSGNYRRTGVGSSLLKAIISTARTHFKVMVLHTDTEQGDSFYLSQGFVREELYPNSSHYIKL